MHFCQNKIMENDEKMTWTAKFGSCAKQTCATLDPVAMVAGGPHMLLKALSS